MTLRETHVFPINDVSNKQLICAAHAVYSDDEENYLDMIPLLQLRERQDLVDAVHLISVRYRLKAWLKKVDVRFFNGTFTQAFAKTSFSKLLTYSKDLLKEK